MRTSVKLVAAATLSLAVAGTCLAAPAFAAGRSSALGGVAGAVAQAAEQAQDQAKGADASSADEAVSVGETVTFAGLTFTVPEGFSQLDDDDTDDEQLLVVANEDATAMVSVYDMRDTGLDADTDWAEYFSHLAQASVEGLDATMEDLGTDTTQGGVTAYGFGIQASDDEGDYYILQVYVPMDEGFVLMQVGYEIGQATEDEVDSLGVLLDSVELASEDGLDIDSLKTSSCGLTFELPEGVSAYDGDENAWMDEDGSIVIKAVGDLVEGASELTEEDYDYLFELLVPEGDAPTSKVTQVGEGTVKGKDVTSQYRSYKVEDPDETMYAVVIVAPAADDSLSLVIAWCTEEGAQAYGTAITDMMETFAQE